LLRKPFNDELLISTVRSALKYVWPEEPEDWS